MTTPDLYAILGVSRAATDAEIKSAYRRRAFETHPDHHPEQGEQAKEAFESVSRAYAVLSNTALKAEYDRTGQIPGMAADTLEAQALSAINQLLGQVLRVDADPFSVDLIPQLRHCLSDEIVNIEKQKHVLTRARGRAQKMQKGFQRTDEKGENALASSMIWHIKQIEMELIPVEEGLKVLKKAHDMLGKYRFISDIPPQVSYAGRATTASSFFIFTG